MKERLEASSTNAAGSANMSSSNTSASAISKDENRHYTLEPPTNTTTTDRFNPMPPSMIESILLTYRSIGIGIFGVVMRWGGMPLEKIALYMNSSQVTTTKASSPMVQAMQLTFQKGFLAPYRVVGPASLVAWFFQYSVMGFAFQCFDHGLSQLFRVKPVYYGHELMEPPPPPSTSLSSCQEGGIDDSFLDYRLRFTIKTILSPFFAASLETMVSNRAEVQRYYGRDVFAQIEKGMHHYHPMAKAAGVGMAFTPCLMRNLVMCQTTFLLTPITYKLYFPQEQKNASTLFWYGLGMNVFVGNVVAITQQSLWGRSLDYLARPTNTQRTIHYGQVLREGLEQEGFRAFFTGPKWFSRVLMNAPAQGVLPWFYNEILPPGEPFVLQTFEKCLYQPFQRLVHSRPQELQHEGSSLGLGSRMPPAATGTTEIKLSSSDHHSMSYTSNAPR